MILASPVKIGDLEQNWNFQKRMALAKDAAEKKKLAENPEALREELRQEEVGRVLNEWVQAINAQLKVKSYLDRWEGAPAAQPKP
jgi:hypothetical protein